MKKIIIVLSILFFSLRLYDLPNRLNFVHDQGLHLLEAFNLSNEKKLFLIGPEVTSRQYQGKSFFIGPQYYYLLIILGKILYWNPLSITVSFMVIEWLSLLFLLYFFRKTFSITASIFAVCYIILNPHFINHSLFFWNPHLLLPLSILFIYLLSKKPQFAFLVWGLAFGFHYSAILWILPILQFRKFKLSYLALFILGNMPYFLFELRHGFYNTLTFISTLSTPSGLSFQIYYLSFSITIFILYYSLRYYYSSKKLSKVISLAILFVFYFYINSKPVFPKSILTYRQLLTAAKQIKQKCPSNFNVAQTISGDTRAYNLRLVLTTLGCPPSSVDSYPGNSTLFLIAPDSRPPREDDVWEVKSLGSFKQQVEISLDNSVKLYRLDRI